MGPLDQHDETNEVALVHGLGGRRAVADVRGAADNRGGTVNMNREIAEFELFVDFGSSEFRDELFFRLGRAGRMAPS